MYQVNEDNSIYVTRGDIVIVSVSAVNKIDNMPYTFQPGEVLRIKVYGKKNAENVVLQKDFPITSNAQTVDLFLSEEDTKIGEVISKPKDYWYEVELNPYDDPQTIIGYDEDGAKVFKLFPEGDDIPEYVPDPEVIKVIDTELDMASERPVQNQVIARAFANLQAGYKATHDAVAKLHVTPQMFGAIGDGVADDTEAIKTAILAIAGGCHNLYFPAGTYLVSEDICLVSNMTLYGDGVNSIIKRIGNGLTNYSVISCNGIDNVTIKDVQIQGERYEHTGTDGEWGMCIGLYDCTGITIDRCKLRYGWGDGVYVGTDNGDGCKDVTINHTTIDYNRRNGVSVVECDGFRMLNSVITNTDGTSPKAGIDFEANEEDQKILNCIVDNCVFSGNLIDVAFYDRSGVQATLQNCNMASKYGIQYDSVSFDEKVTDCGVIVLNCILTNANNCFLSNRKHINSAPVQFVGCFLSADTVAVQVGGASVAYANKMGDLHFVDCYIAKSPNSTGWVRYQNTETDYPLEDVTLAVRLGEGVLYHNFYTNVNYCKLSADIKCEPKVYTGSALTINKNNAEPLICLDTRENSCEVTLSHSIPFGLPITIRKLYVGNTVTILNEAETFGQFDYASQFSFSGRFDEVTIVHEEAGVWRVVDNTVGITH